MVNESIKTYETVHLIGVDGKNIGVISTKEAEHIAEEAGFDLVVVSPDVTPPVCRIMDYSKWCYQKKQKEKAIRKQQRQQKADTETKEIRLSTNIDMHDMETKASSAKKFLTKGNTVKVSVRFQGREIEHYERGYQVIEQFVQMLGDTVKIKGSPKMEGYSMCVFLRN